MNPILTLVGVTPGALAWLLAFVALVEAVVPPEGGLHGTLDPVRCPFAKVPARSKFHWCVIWNPVSKSIPLTTAFGFEVKLNTPGADWAPLFSALYPKKET